MAVDPGIAVTVAVGNPKVFRKIKKEERTCFPPLLFFKVVLFGVRNEKIREVKHLLLFNLSVFLSYHKMVRFFMD